MPTPPTAAEIIDVLNISETPTNPIALGNLLIALSDADLSAGADPGASGALRFSGSAAVPIVSTAAQTRTLPIPSYVGQEILLFLDTDGGDVVITASQPINQAGNNTITLDAVGETIRLHAISIAGALRWRVASNDGATLSSV